jgi:hypothetical protein
LFPSLFNPDDGGSSNSKPHKGATQLAACFPHFSTLMMGAVYAPEALVGIYQIVKSFTLLMDQFPLQDQELSLLHTVTINTVTLLACKSNIYRGVHASV